jgi:large subunit ribosomal protein L16
MRGQATRGNTVEFGDYGLQSLDLAWLDARHIEAGRVALTHYLAREGRVYVRVFPHKSVSAKPLESRMGKGKGEPEHWVAVVKPGTIVFEVAGVDLEAARHALARAAHKMPIATRLVARRTRR